MGEFLIFIFSLSSSKASRIATRLSKGDPWGKTSLSSCYKTEKIICCVDKLRIQNRRMMNMLQEGIGISCSFAVQS